MKIGPIDTKTVAAAAPIERKQAAGAGGQPAEASAQVALSSTASAMGGVNADPTFDSAKVERIAQAIRDGQFQINPEAIADKLIENARELLSRRPS